MSGQRVKQWGRVDGNYRIWSLQASQIVIYMHVGLPLFGGPCTGTLVFGSPSELYSSTAFRRSGMTCHHYKNRVEM